MKKTWKRGIITALSAALIVSNGMPAKAASAGWRKDASGWHYVNANGSYQTGWVQDRDGQWYFMDYHTGLMKTGWIKPRDGKWYFLDYHTGAMRTGWIKPRDGQWYFMDYHNGDMLTGWIKPRDNKWYYLDTGSGAMKTGTVTIDNKVWTLDAGGAWNEKEASNATITYIYSNRYSGSSSTSSYWRTSADQSIRVNRITREVEVLKGGTDQNPIVCNKDAVNKLVSGAADRISKLTIKSSVADGTVVLDGLTVTGNTIVEGGGSSSIKFTNCSLKNALKARKAKEANPLHLLFEAGTGINRVEIEGGNVIITANITISEVYAKSSVVLKGIGKIGSLEIAADIYAVLSGQIQADKIKTAAGIKPKVEVEKTAKVEAVEGDAVFTGEGTVKDFYDVVLNANGGYWEVKTLNEKGGEVVEKVPTQILKAKKNEIVSNLVTAAGIGNPVQANGVFTGWYESADAKDAVDLTKVVVSDKAVQLMAKWNITAVDPVVSTITATISGSSVTASVNGTAAELRLATGSAVSADSTVTVNNFSAKAKVSSADETEVVGTVSCSAAAVKVGQPFAVVFTPEDKVKYKPVTILVTIRVAEE
ncbi:MAG: hypothetical protein OSJ62_11675 [Lachnospiraceae bacterium]|nr:hypothetical protein [Lachnospiraceae bacterium]